MENNNNYFQSTQPPNPNPQQQWQQPWGQMPLPNSTAVLVLGICSIVGCIFYGVPGIICSIIALVLGGKANALYNSNPQMYTQASYNNMKAGRICAVVGICLSIFYIIFLIAFVGAILNDSRMFGWH